MVTFDSVHKITQAEIISRNLLRMTNRIFKDVLFGEDKHIQVKDLDPGHPTGSHVAHNDPEEYKRVMSQSWGIPGETMDAYDSLSDEEKGL